MTDSIIVLILVVLIAIGVRATSKHFKGEGSCCGGGTYKLRKKKLDSVVSHKKGIAVVSMSQPIEDGAIKAAIEKAGYMVSGIH